MGSGLLLSHLSSINQAYLKSSSLIVSLKHLSTGGKKAQKLKIVLFGSQIENLSLEDSLSDSSEGLLQRGRGRCQDVYDFGKGYSQSNIHLSRRLLLLTRNR